MGRQIKFKVIYQSPNTNIPNELLVSEPIELQEMMEGRFQVNFTNGGYLMSNEMDDEHTRWTEFTGLHDKNGREIYEGDIIHSPYGDRNGEIRYYVGVNDVGWVVAFGNMPGQSYSVGPVTIDGCEVLGNIYESPEFLEQENEV